MRRRYRRRRRRRASKGGTAAVLNFQHPSKRYYRTRRLTRRKKRGYKRFLGNLSNTLGTHKYYFETSTQQTISANRYAASALAVAIGTGYDAELARTSPNSDLMNCFFTHYDNQGQTTGSNKMILKSMILTMEIKLNNINNGQPVNVDLYTIYPRKDTRESIANLYGTSLTSNVFENASGYTNKTMQATVEQETGPFITSLFGNKYKVYKQQRISLEPNVNNSFMFIKKIGVNKVIDREDLQLPIPVVMPKKCAMGYLIVIRRAGGSITQELANITTIKSTRTYTCKFLEDNDTKFTHVIPSTALQNDETNDSMVEEGTEEEGQDDSMVEEAVQTEGHLQEDVQ